MEKEEGRTQGEQMSRKVGEEGERDTKEKAFLRAHCARIAGLTAPA